MASFFMANDIPIQGTPEEIKTFTEVMGHYKIAKQDLEQRMFRKNGFDDADKMFASHIDEGKWPYRSMIYDPRPYTVILEKSARLIGSKPKGRLVPREGGDTLGAYINNELLSFQWDDNARLGESMISKWILMDQNTRKYGSSFALIPWRWEQRVFDGKKKTFYDGPDMKVCNSRDVLANPSYSFINKWFQYREWMTLDDLKAVNDAHKGEPKYRNLGLLEDAMTQESKAKGDQRSSSYTIPNKSIRGLTDFMGQDKVFKPFEVITEYRCERWITFSPRYGLILRDIPNPYKHYEIPVVHLKYYPLQDDLYGQSELEPISKLVRGLNAHLSAYSDRTALRLMPPLMVNPINVRMHTLEWSPEAKWLMNQPNVDVQTMRTESGEDAAFNTIYQVFLGAILSGVGENSQGVSQANPTKDAGNVTATEIRDSAFTRNVRDNMNKIFLSEALKAQIMMWHNMNQQYLFSTNSDKVKVIRIVGRDAVEFFKRQGISDIRPTDQDAQDSMMAQSQGLPQEPVLPGPRFPVSTEQGLVPKFQPDVMGEGGDLYMEPGDLNGEYDYIPDIESMSAPSSQDVEQKLTTILGVLSNPQVIQLLAMEGKQPKVQELLVKMFESTNVIKDADAYFQDIQQPPMGQIGGPNGQVNQGGAGAPQAGQPAQAPNGAGGMEQGVAPVAPTQTPQLMG